MNLQIIIGTYLVGNQNPNKVFAELIFDMLLFQLCAFAGTDHGDMLPRLLHSGNASQIDIILDKLSTQYPSSRFGIHLITASNDNVNATVKVNGRRTLDDEHAPGVFNVSYSFASLQKF